MTTEELKNLANNKESLGVPIATVENGKTKIWGYQTVEITKDNITIAEGDGFFTIEEGSKYLDIPFGTGEKALIILVDGNIGGMAYYDYIKVVY